MCYIAWLDEMSCTGVCKRIVTSVYQVDTENSAFPWVRFLIKNLHPHSLMDMWLRAYCRFTVCIIIFEASQRNLLCWYVTLIYIIV